MNACNCFTASEKLGIPGRKLVLEEDGTEIVDDDALECELINRSVLILLRDGETWRPAGGGIFTEQLSCKKSCRAVTAIEFFLPFEQLQFHLRTFLGLILYGCHVKFAIHKKSSAVAERPRDDP